jgi:membrane glycosyltransferase
MAFGLYGVALLLGFAPRLLGVLDIVFSGRARQYGGAWRMTVGCALDWSFSMLIGPIMMLAQTVFIGGLAFGRRVIWEAQNREDRSVTLKEALNGLWPQLSFGLAAATVLGLFMPRAILWAGLTIGPCLAAAPFACLTSTRALGRAMTRARLCAIPDEFAPAWEIGGPSRHVALEAAPAIPGLEPADAA